MRKKLLVVGCVLFLFAGSVMAQDGGGLMFEPPYLTANVSDSAVFKLDDFRLGEDGSASFELYIGAEEAPEQACQLAVRNGTVDEKDASAAMDCGALAYSASWDRTAIPAGAEIIRVSLISRQTAFRSLFPISSEPAAMPAGWGVAYHSPLAISFYGADGASKTDLGMEGNLALSTTIRTQSAVKFNIMNLREEKCKVAFDSVVEIEKYAEQMNEDYRLSGIYADDEFVDFNPGDPVNPNFLTSRYEINSCPNGEDPTAEAPQLEGVSLDFSVPTVQVEYLSESGVKGIWQDAILNFFAINFVGS